MSTAGEVTTIEKLAGKSLLVCTRGGACHGVNGSQLLGESVLVTVIGLAQLR